MPASKRQPGPYCQEGRPLWLDTGTSALIDTPSPAPELDPPIKIRPHSIRYVDEEPRLRSVSAPDEVSFELGDAPRMCVETSLTEISLVRLRVLAWLRLHRSEIIAAEQKYRVDRRAIAGAIAWEAIVNPYGRGARAVGPGKAHLWDFGTSDTLIKQVEDADWLPPDERLPKRSYSERKELQKTSAGAITYMAAAMNAASRLARNAGFPSIRKEPKVLTYFWQKRDLRTWTQHLKSKPPGTAFKPGPDPVADMDQWVLRNQQYLEDAVGVPQFTDD